MELETGTKTLDLRASVVPGVASPDIDPDIDDLADQDDIMAFYARANDTTFLDDQGLDYDPDSCTFVYSVTDVEQPAQSARSIEVWHCILGDMSEDSLKRGQRDRIWDGYPLVQVDWLTTGLGNGMPYDTSRA